MSVKRYTNGADDDQGTILPFMEESPNGDYVEYADYARLKAEVERLKGIILAQSSDFVRSKTADESIKPDGHNDLAGRAVERCLELQAEVERLTTWRPMETAPLDGTDVLCVCLDPEFEGEDNPNRYIRTCFFGLMTEDYRCWMSVFGYEENPTHWMPLPAAPAKEERP